MAKSSKKQTLFVIVGAAGIVITLVMVMLVASGVITMPGAKKGAGYQNVTFTDSVVTCDKEVRSTHGKRIQSLMVDNHSSRYDQSSNVYKIFLQMTLHPKKTGAETQSVYVNCFVSASRGRIKNLVYLDADSSSSGSDAADGTNFFGIPKRN